jgi:hypothetical protein
MIHPVKSLETHVTFSKQSESSKELNSPLKMLPPDTNHKTPI